jgi:hypothetical protein
MDDQDTIREWLKQVPHKLLAAENGRRNDARRRKASSGRPKGLAPLYEVWRANGHARSYQTSILSDRAAR